MVLVTVPGPTAHAGGLSSAGRPRRESSKSSGCGSLRPVRPMPPMSLGTFPEARLASDCRVGAKPVDDKIDEAAQFGRSAATLLMHDVNGQAPGFKVRQCNLQAAFDHMLRNLVG